MVQVPRAHDLVRLRPQRRCPPQRLVPGVRVADPAPVGLQSRDVAQTSESSRQTHGSAGQRRRRVHSRRHSASRRLGPYDEVMIEQESTTRMTMPDDEIATALQVVGMDLAQLVGPHALYPRRNPTANVGATPGALPELTVRPPRRSADLGELPRPTVPRPGREVVEAVEAVVLVPDEPASVESAPRLVDLRVGERLDPHHGTRPARRPRNAASTPPRRTSGRRAPRQEAPWPSFSRRLSRDAIACGATPRSSPPCTSLRACKSLPPERWRSRVRAPLPRPGRRPRAA